MIKRKWFQSSKTELKISFDVLHKARVILAMAMNISQSPLHSFVSCYHALGSAVEDCGGEQGLKEEGTGGKDLWHKLEAETCTSGEQR